MAGQAVKAHIGAFLRQAGIEIGGNASHVAGAKAFHPGLLEHVIYFTRLTGGRARAFMHGGVVMAQAQGGGIGGTAHAGHFRLGHATRGVGQAHMRAGNRHAGRHGTVEERDLGLGLSAHGPHGANRGALEALGGAGLILGLRGGGLFPVLAHACLPCHQPRGASGLALKQRW